MRWHRDPYKNQQSGPSVESKTEAPPAPPEQTTPPAEPEREAAVDEEPDDQMARPDPDDDRVRHAARWADIVSAYTPRPPNVRPETTLSMRPDPFQPPARDVVPAPPIPEPPHCNGTHGPGACQWCDALAGVVTALRHQEDRQCRLDERQRELDERLARVEAALAAREAGTQ